MGSSPALITLAASRTEPELNPRPSISLPSVFPLSYGEIFHLSGTSPLKTLYSVPQIPIFRVYIHEQWWLSGQTRCHARVDPGSIPACRTPRGGGGEGGRGEGGGLTEGGEAPPRVGGRGIFFISWALSKNR